MKDSGLLLFDLTRCLQPQVVPGKFRCHSSARSAVDKSGFDQERLVDLLDRSGVFADGRGDGVQSYGTAAELFDDRSEDLVVHLIESARVDIERRESDLCDFEVDVPFALDHGEVAHSAQQRVGDSGRAARAERHLVRRVVVDRDVQNARRAFDDAGQHRGVVIFQMALDAEARPQGRGQQAAACGGAYEREGRQLDLDRTRRRAFVEYGECFNPNPDDCCNLKL